MVKEINSWKCGVCGYVSDTEEPPLSCPVCGVPQEKFEPYRAKHQATDKPDYWQCMVCRYQHRGDLPPDICPVCGVGRENFEGKKEEVGGDSVLTDSRVVIAGAGIAGVAAAEEIRRLSDKIEIILIHREKDLPYYRLNLTRYIAGEVGTDLLPVHPESWYLEKDINLMTESQVLDINPPERTITLNSGNTLSFDRLIITAGSQPFMPPVPGAGLDGVTTLRYLNDADYIISQAGRVKSVFVVGGGVLGLEVAGALRTRNKELSITIVENYDYLMPRQLNRKAAGYLKNYLEGLGINVITGLSVSEIEGDDRVEAIRFGNGEIMPADLIVFSVGVRPVTFLARSADLKVNHGVIVDDNMETSFPGIYAAGDIAEHRGVLYGLWNAAMFQGKIAGMNAAGKKADFGGIPRSNTLKVLDVDLFSIGSFTPCDGSCMYLEEENENEYKYILFKDNRIEGALLFGDTSMSAFLKTAIEEKISFPLSAIKSGEIKEIFSFLSQNSKA